MSFQWTVIAAVLYAEIAVTVLLMLPIISSTRWKKLFQSNIGQSISAYANYYFNIFMLLLGLCFLDSLREMRKYQSADKASASMSTQVGTMEHMNMKLFRAQRNFYIAGFALFMWFVIRRLITLLMEEAFLQEQLGADHVKFRDERDALETKIADLTERLNRVNENAIDMDAANEANVRLASLQTAYDELKLRVEQSQCVEEIGEQDDSHRERLLLDELDEVKELLSGSQSELITAKAGATETKEEFDRLFADYQDLQVRYNLLVESGSGDKTD